MQGKSPSPQVYHGSEECKVAVESEPATQLHQHRTLYDAFKGGFYSQVRTGEEVEEGTGGSSLPEVTSINNTSVTLLAPPKEGTFKDSKLSVDMTSSSQLGNLSGHPFKAAGSLAAYKTLYSSRGFMGGPSNDSSQSLKSVSPKPIHIVKGSNKYDFKEAAQREVT